MEPARKSTKQTPKGAATTPRQVSEAMHSLPQAQITYAGQHMQAASPEDEVYLQSTEITRATHIQPSLPTIMLTEATPLPDYDDIYPLQGDMEQIMTSRASSEAVAPTIDPLFLERPQAHSSMPDTPTQQAPSPPPFLSQVPVQFVSRPVEDIIAIFDSMTSGNFAHPVFGEEGLAFHERVAGRLRPRTPPRNVFINVIRDIPHPRTADALGDRPQTPDTPTPKPKPKRKPRKRKRDLTPDDMAEQEIEGVKEEPVGKRLKGVKIQDAT
jgi:hypothetical protein